MAQFKHPDFSQMKMNKLLIYILVFIGLIGCAKFHPTQPAPPDNTLPYGECYSSYHWDAELEECIPNFAPMDISED